MVQCDKNRMEICTQSWANSAQPRKEPRKKGLGNP